jgi:hypothetical protein
MPTMNTAISDNATVRADAPIPPEVMAAIAAAAAVFVGKRLRILGIEQMHLSHEPVNRWSRQGRVLVQSSHNLPVKHLARAR